MKLTAKYKRMDIKTREGDQVSTMNSLCRSSTCKLMSWVMHFPTKYTDINFISCFMKNYLHLFCNGCLPVL